MSTTFPSVQIIAGSMADFLLWIIYYKGFPELRRRRHQHHQFRKQEQFVEQFVCWNTDLIVHFKTNK